MLRSASGGFISSLGCPGFDTKLFDGEVPVIREIQCTPSLPSLPGSLWPGVVTFDMVQCIGQRELNCALMLN